MSNRIYIRNYGSEPDVELDAEDSIVFERDGVPIRVDFDNGGDLKVSADERVTISPEASNVFVVRVRSGHKARAAARRAKKTLATDLRTLSVADLQILIDEVLR